MEHIGKKLDRKRVFVKESPPYERDKYALWLAKTREALHLTEQDGWFTHDTDYNGHHVTHKGYTLDFYRFVPRDGSGL